MAKERTIYVNINVTKGGDGSEKHPFKNINDAAQIAKAGDTVLVAPGIYREYVCPKNKGEEDDRIVYKSEKPLGAVITGAEVLKDWTHYEGDVWTARVGNGIFGSYNPYTTYVCGDWYFAPKVRHTGAVFFNDRMMYETVTLEECIEGEADHYSWVPDESKYKWFSVVEGNETVFYANFKGKNPNEEKVEIAVRRNCFMPDKNGVDYITVSGFAIEKAATTWAPPAAYQDGMIGPHWSKGWIIEDCEVSNSNAAVYLSASIAMKKTICIFIPSMSRVPLRWRGMRYAEDNIMAGPRRISDIISSEDAMCTTASRQVLSEGWERYFLL